MIDYEAIKPTYFSECADLLTDLDTHFSDFSEIDKAPDAALGAYRKIHSIKGSSGVFDFKRVITVAHEIETLLQGTISKEPGELAALAATFLRARDILSDLIAAEQTGEQLPGAYEQPVLEELRQFVSAQANERTGQDSDIPKDQKPEDADPQPLLDDVVGGRAFVNSTIRVERDRIDNLINQVSEIIISQSSVMRHVDEALHQSHPELAQAISHYFRQSVSLQDAVMAIRAQPIGTVFASLPRLVRELAAQSGKSVRITFSGENTEIDQTVVQRLYGPLTHMIRNAVDHGLELPVDREAAGKHKTGEIVVAAAQQGECLRIVVSDDGRGLDAEKIRQTAIKRDLITETDKLSTEEINGLIFKSGFSTAGRISDISGRGIGMDIILQDIHNLGGRILVNSSPGNGCEMELILPLSFAVIEGMVVDIAGQTCVLPLSAIRQCVSGAAAHMRRVPDLGAFLQLNDQLIRFADLHRLLQNRADNDSGLPSQTDSEVDLALLVETHEGASLAIKIDRFLGQQQIVVKSIEENFTRIDGISGATVLGDGEIALILDVSSIYELLGGKIAGETSLGEHVETAA